MQSNKYSKMSCHVILGVVTLAAMMAPATSQYCYRQHVGSETGDKVSRSQVVPAGVLDYDVPVPYVCDHTGLTVSGCSDYEWSLNLLGLNEVHVHRNQLTSEEIVLKLDLYCPQWEYQRSSDGNDTSVVENWRTRENDDDDDNLIEERSSRIKRSGDKQKKNMKPETRDEKNLPRDDDTVNVNRAVNDQGGVGKAKRDKSKKVKKVVKGRDDE